MNQSLILRVVSYSFLMAITILVATGRRSSTKRLHVSRVSIPLKSSKDQLDAFIDRVEEDHDSYNTTLAIERANLAIAKWGSASMAEDVLLARVGLSVDVRIDDDDED